MTHQALLAIALVTGLAACAEKPAANAPAPSTSTAAPAPSGPAPTTSAPAAPTPTPTPTPSAGGVCTPGADQTCNDNPAVSALHGTCNADRTCTCKSGFAKNPQTGKCK